MSADTDQAAPALAEALGWWIRLGLVDVPGEAQPRVQVETRHGLPAVEDLLAGFIRVQPYDHETLYRVGLALLVADAAALSREAFARSPAEGVRMLLDLEERYRGGLHSALSVVAPLVARMNGTTETEKG